MTRPRALDLCCGAGGVSMGLYRAGFDVFGVDIDGQPNYPFWFRRGDALAPPVALEDFEFVWASPPCQAHTAGNRYHRKHGLVSHPCIIAPLREVLEASGRLYCIENVPDAPLRADLKLDGPMFGLKVFRRRHFEMNFRAMQPQLSPRVGPQSDPSFVSVFGSGGKRDGNLATWRAAMGIGWMSRREIVDAIPPPYAEYIGRAALAALERAGGGTAEKDFTGPVLAPAPPLARSTGSELGQGRPTETASAWPSPRSPKPPARGQGRPTQLDLEEALAERVA